MSTTPAERVRAYLKARAKAGRIGADIFTRQGLIARHGSHYLTEADLSALLPPETPPRSPALEVHDTWYSARTPAPENALWIETRDPEEFREQCAKAPDPSVLVLRRHTVYLYGTSQILKSGKELP